MPMNELVKVFAVIEQEQVLAYILSDNKTQLCAVVIVALNSPKAYKRLQECLLHHHHEVQWWLSDCLNRDSIDYLSQLKAQFGGQIAVVSNATQIPQYPEVDSFLQRNEIIALGHLSITVQLSNNIENPYVVFCLPPIAVWLPQPRQIHAMWQTLAKSLSHLSASLITPQTQILLPIVTALNYRSTYEVPYWQVVKYLI